MIAGVIQARIGSQRCKRKMVRQFGNTTLIELALEKYSKPSSKFKLYFAAHEPELLEVGERYDVEIVKREKRSATGENIEDVMNYLDQITEDTVIFINPSHPFMTLTTVEQAVSEFETQSARSLTSVVRAHTWFYKLDGSPINFLDPTNLNTKRTEPLLQVVHAFHIFDRKRFLQHHYFWEHKSLDPILFEVPEFEAIDIDTELDFLKAEALYIKTNNKF